ncbi:DUF3598 family protein [Lyngbya aestuarii]|uniref:DUF3598 family protein n=1 Tax=Lyngbya aestuarii TaxID=118322 RepID=UPI00403DC6FF
MSSQWEYLLKNLGEWQGSFTRISPQGEELEDTPSLLILEGLNNNRTIRQTLRRFPPQQAVEEKVLEYSCLSGNILFFANGTFSQGYTRWQPSSGFGTEFSFIDSNRRLRLSQLFNQEGKLTNLTLIRERRTGTDTPRLPQLTLDQLLGEWQGEGVTIYPDGRDPQTYPTLLQLHCEENNRLVQKLTFGAGESVRTITSTARIDGSILYFEQKNLTVQVLLLPNGASSNCPVEIKPGHFFVLEAGWLLKPDLRQRLIRSYNPRGEWVNLTLVTEKKLR